MEIQAYFEEWSRRPGDIVRMAVSTAQDAVHASFVRLQSGPGQGENGVGRVLEMPFVLNKTFAGRVQATAVGSYARLPLPAPVGAGEINICCWYRSAPRPRRYGLWAIFLSSSRVARCS
jgi:hypothetical protein